MSFPVRSLPVKLNHRVVHVSDQGALERVLSRREATLAEARGFGAFFMALPFPRERLEGPHHGSQHRCASDPADAETNETTADSPQRVDRHQGLTSRFELRLNAARWNAPIPLWPRGLPRSAVRLAAACDHRDPAVSRRKLRFLPRG